MTYPGGRTSFSVEGDDAVSLKRIAACLFALYMPEAGVEENWESTIDRFRYYREQSLFPELPQETLPSRVTGAIVRVDQRPDFILDDL